MTIFCLRYTRTKNIYCFWAFSSRHFWYKTDFSTLAINGIPRQFWSITSTLVFVAMVTARRHPRRLCRQTDRHPSVILGSLGIRPRGIEVGGFRYGAEKPSGLFVTSLRKKFWKTALHLLFCICNCILVFFLLQGLNLYRLSKIYDI